MTINQLEELEFTTDNVLQHILGMVEFILDETEREEYPLREYVETLHEELTTMITHLDLYESNELNLSDDEYESRRKLEKANLLYSNLEEANKRIKYLTKENFNLRYPF